MRSSWKELDCLSYLRMGSSWRLGVQIRKFTCSPLREDIRSWLRVRSRQVSERLVYGWTCAVCDDAGQIPAQVFRVDMGTGQRTAWRPLEPADAAGSVRFEGY